MSGDPEPRNDTPVGVTASEQPRQSSSAQVVVRSQQGVTAVSADEARTSGRPSAALLSWDELARYPQEIQRIIVIDWAEKQKHSRALESRRQHNAFIERALGLMLGSALALVFIVGGVLVVLSGHGAEGLIGIGTTVTAIAVVYVRRGRRKS